jgi:hypothetical protein
MLKIRFGATPVVDVKMPYPVPVTPVHAVVHWSVQYGPTAYVAVAIGIHVGLNALFTVPNVRWPFEPTATFANVWSYNVYENGSAITVEPSSV